MRYILLIICFGGLVSGCSPKPVKIDPNARWKALAPFVKRQFKTEKSVEEIAADLSLAAYNLGLK